MIAAVTQSPNDVAQTLTGRDYLSWSAVSSYLKCPLRYKFRYLDKLPEPFVSVNLVFGAAIYSALEAYFRELLAAGRPLSLGELLAAYHDHWSRIDLQTVEFGHNEDLLSLGQLAERMLTAFLASTLAQPDGRIIGIEEELKEGVIPGCPDLLARLDLLTEQDDAVVVTDLKTSRSRWSQADVDAGAGQVLIYHELVQKLTDKPIRLQFAVLTKTKSPQLDLLPVPVDPARTQRIKHLIGRVWNAITSGHFYPAPSAMNCSGCPYRGPCDAWPHGSP